MPQANTQNLPPVQLVQQKAQEGWRYVATEALTGLRPGLNGLSSDLPLQMEVELKKKYGQAGNEVQFVLSSDEVIFPTDEMFKVAPDTEDKLCYVFVRTKK